jgi:hypothetical protein
MSGVLITSASGFSISRPKVTPRESSSVCRNVSLFVEPQDELVELLDKHRWTVAGKGRPPCSPGASAYPFGFRCQTTPLGNPGA